MSIYYNKVTFTHCFEDKRLSKYEVGLTFTSDVQVSQLTEHQMSHDNDLCADIVFVTNHYETC